jgi:hypothetical protein
VTPFTPEWLQNLVDLYFDETIDGDLTNPDDLQDFYDPFIHTYCLQHNS